MTMGTASTMAAMVEAWVSATPQRSYSSGGFPARSSRPGCGRRIVEMVREDQPFRESLPVRPLRMQFASTERLVVRPMRYPTSAIAGRIGISLKLEDGMVWGGRPQLVNLMPSGNF